MTDDTSDVATLRAVVKLMDMQRRILIEGRADPNLTRVYGAIVRHLHSLTELQALRIVRGSKHAEIASAERLRDAPRMASMALEEVEHLAADEKTPRTILESVAVGRFQVPRGSLRSIGKSDQLREKILTMARNERAHTTIAQVAKDAGRDQN